MSSSGKQAELESARARGVRGLPRAGARARWGRALSQAWRARPGDPAGPSPGARGRPSPCRVPPVVQHRFNVGELSTAFLEGGVRIGQKELACLFTDQQENSSPFQKL